MNSSSISKVLLINLPEEGQCADFYTPQYAIDDFSVYPPLGLLYVATVARDYYPVEIMDVVALRYGIQDTVDEVLQRSPTVYLSPSFVFRNVKSDTRKGFSIKQFFFKIKLAFLLTKSYLANLLVEKVNSGGEINEIR